MRLFIDNVEADLDSGLQVSVSLAMAPVTDPGQGRTGYSRSVTIPMTAKNRGIMGACEDVNARDRFNDSLHTARLEFAGCVVMEGAVHLTECRKPRVGIGYYRFNIIGSARLWAAHASSNPLSSLFPSLSAVMSAEGIAGSWAPDAVVKFLPVQRDIHNGESGAADLGREFGLADYHPFIHIYPSVREIFGQAGYKIESRFFDTPFFRSLYMSGRLGGALEAASDNGMDFRAGRFREATAQANYLGRVSANPYAVLNTIGNIVDTADPKEVSGGVSVPGAFDKGGCFRKVDKRVAFVPSAEVTAGFRYELKYVTDYGFKSSTELWGFDTVYLGDNETRRITIPNPYQDRKKMFTANRDFRVIIPGHTSGTYRFGAYRLTNPNADIDNLMPGDYEDVTIAEFSAGSALVSTSLTGNYVYVYLMHTIRSVTMLLPEYNWMLYDGYVRETGKTEVTAVVASSPRTLSAGAPKFFDSMFFGGAAEGMEITLKEAFVTPVFDSAVESVDLDFESVAPPDMSRMDLLNGLRHMFNLCFYTDNVEKKVYVEPRKDFFDGPTVDWSDRVDYSQSVTVRELGDDVGRTVTLLYKTGDGAVARMNGADGETFGSWSAAVGNLYASEKGTVMRNPIFSPSVNTAGNLAGCPSASLLNAGDRDSTADKNGGLDFPLKIVGYAGMKALPQGESWVWPSAGGSYPLAAFHYPVGEDGFSLCFEDRDGIAGLHEYWDGNIEAYNTGRRLTVWLRLGADDIEAIMRPNSLKRDFRARFRLRIDGEDSLWYLEEVCGYNPSDPSTKCVLIKV